MRLPTGVCPSGTSRRSKHNTTKGLRARGILSACDMQPLDNQEPYRDSAACRPEPIGDVLGPDADIRLVLVVRVHVPRNVAVDRFRAYRQQAANSLRKQRWHRSSRSRRASVPATESGRPLRTSVTGQTRCHASRSTMAALSPKNAANRPPYLHLVRLTCQKERMRFLALTMSLSKGDFSPRRSQMGVVTEEAVAVWSARQLRVIRLGGEPAVLSRDDVAV